MRSKCGLTDNEFVLTSAIASRLAALETKIDVFMQAVGQMMASTESASANPAPVQQLFISEKEAAKLAGMAPKTLADRRRDGLVSRKLYRQDKRCGRVLYCRDKWISYLTKEDTNGKTSKK